MKAIQNVVKVTSVFLVAVALLVVSPLNSRANNDKEKITKISEDQFSVSYTGSTENSVMFRVNFKNTTAQKFSLIIKNEVGDVVYQEQYNSGDLNKAIHILREDGEFKKATFIIRVNGQQLEQRFVIDRSTQVVENVVVTKLYSTYLKN